MIDERAVDALRAEYVEHGLGERFGELVGAFVTHTADRLAELVDATDRADLAEVARVAHMIRGGSATFGATGLAAMCADIEDAARSGDAATATRLVCEADAALRPTSDALLERR